MLVRHHVEFARVPHLGAKDLWIQEKVRAHAFSVKKVTTESHRGHLLTKFLDLDETPQADQYVATGRAWAASTYQSSSNTRLGTHCLKAWCHATPEDGSSHCCRASPHHCLQHCHHGVMVTHLQGALRDFFVAVAAAAFSSSKHVVVLGVRCACSHFYVCS